MANEFEIEDTKDIPAEESKAGVVSDSAGQSAPVVEQEGEVAVAQGPTPLEPVGDDAGDVEAVRASTDEKDFEETGGTTEEALSEPDAAALAMQEPQEAAAEDIEDVSPGAEESELLESPRAETEAEAGDGAVEAAEAFYEEAGDDRSWYVVHCYSGYENKVRHNLEQRIETMGMKDRIFDVVVPTEEEIEVKDGKRKTIERRVFPGYILVQMIMTEESWYVVRNTPGVTGFVGMGNEPTALRPEEVSQIIKRMEAEAPRIKLTYKIGQKVRITDGPFNEFIGTVDDIDMERATVRVMVSFFGRETPVELDFLQVEKA